MTSFQDKLQQKFASAQALMKAAGEECGVEKAKSPEELIGDAADVQVTDNLPAGVEVPGSEGLEATGDVAEDRGTDVGHVETNGPAPENNEGNTEVQEILDVAEHVTKHANMVGAMALNLLSLTESAFSGLGKQASAEPTDADVERYILKQAAAGNPIMRGIVAFCQNWNAAAAQEALQKRASDGCEECGDEAEVAEALEDAGADEGALEEGGDIEAAAAEAQEEVADTLINEAGMDEEQAMELAGQAVASVMDELGGDSEEGEELEDLVEDSPEEAVDALTEYFMEEGGLDEDTAQEVAIESVAGVLEGDGADEGGEEIADEIPMGDELDKTASAEDGEEDEGPADEPAEDTVEEAEEETPAVGGDEINETIDGLVEALAAEIQQQDPEISEDEALEAAAEQVADAVETVEAQQAIGAADENGEPLVSDEDAAAAVDEMAKSASAYPLRGQLAAALNERLGLSPEAFAARLNIQ